MKKFAFYRILFVYLQQQNEQRKKITTKQTKKQTIMTTTTKKDSRISRDLCVYQFEAIANEYLAEYGRKTSGGSRMTWNTFECWSYAKDRTEKQIDICIHYESQTISITTRS